MTEAIEPPNSVLLLVGREEFTPPSSFDGGVCVATADCIAVGVLSVGDGPTTVSFSFDQPTSKFVDLGQFEVETEGQLSVRDVYNREYLSAGVEPGSSLVTVWGDDAREPSRLIIQVGHR